MANNPGNGLVIPNHLTPLTKGTTWIPQNFLSITSHIYGTTAVAIIVVLALVNINYHKLWTTYKVRFWKVREKELKEEEDSRLPDRAMRLFIRFSVDELRLATRNFSDALVIGKGGFGKVYKGVIGNEQLPVAIKRSKAYSRQSRHAFLTEIKALCEVRHINLVSLIGYCDESREMILVYEFMSGGTLHDHLHKLAVSNDSDSFLTWKKRLNICIGAARGLDYLHTGHRIIHHDVKTSNILLDGDFTAKVADFGLAKARPDGASELKSEQLRGTFGYFDPHYVTTRILTRKVDTYAFGVVLLEVLCERLALDRMTLGEERSLAKWAQNRINEGKVNDIVASTIVRQVLPDSLKTFVEVAQSCLDEEPKKRPTMAQVVVKLELALDQQDGRNLLIPNMVREVTDVQNVTASAMEQTNSQHELPTKNKDGRAVDMYLSCFWTKGDLRNKVKPIKKRNLASKGKSNDSKLFLEALSEIRQANIRIREFDFAYIADATNQFSTANKIGQGGFGSVYKGILPTGQMIAVKRRQDSSMHGLEEFKCEILSLSKLQHCAIVAILGYCMRGKDLMLVYDFMENHSLDHYVNDERRSSLLDWALRFKIIVSIVKGMIYLHQDSGMRIIHRDIKPSNILLDANMNPKISDFGLAMTLEDHEPMVEVSRVAGTCGYIAPEYLLHGAVSTMLDVYSLGLLILVTLSGKLPHLSFGCDKSLVAYAWELWNLGKELDLVDNSIRGSASKEEALRCIQVGLLCTQVECGDRPTMPTVLKILKGEESLLNLHDKIARAPPILDFQYYSHSGNTSYSISSMNREVLGADELSLDLREIYGMPGIDTSGDSSAMATNNVESTTDKEKVLTNIMTSKSKSKRGIREVIASMMARMGGSSRGSRKNLRIAF